jgi:H+/gluconate symporter-like permease
VSPDSGKQARRHAYVASSSRARSAANSGSGPRTCSRGLARAAAALRPLLSLAVGIRLAAGSATVATVTASGLMAPIVKDLHDVHLPLMALAVGAGSLFFSHVNDAGFWLVKEYFGMSVGQTIATWSCMETLLSVVGPVLILLLGFLL